MTIPESLGEALLVDGTLKSKPVARRKCEGRFILYILRVTLRERGNRRVSATEG